MFHGFPSKERVRQLAKEGVFPWSSLVTRSVIAAALVGMLLWGSAALEALTLADMSNIEDLSFLKEGLCLDTARLVIMSALVVLVAGVTGGLIQTRGVFGVGVLRSLRERSAFLGGIDTVLALVVGVAFGSVVCFRFTPSVLESIKIEGGSIVFRYFGTIWRDLGKEVIVELLVLAVGLLGISRLTFLLGLRVKRRGRQ